MISSPGVSSGTATSIISSTSATNSPYSTTKSGVGAAASAGGATHVAFSEGVKGDPAIAGAVPSVDSGERYYINHI